MRAAVSAPGLLFALAGLAAMALPFLTLRANRILAGESIAITAVSAPGVTVAALAIMLMGLGLGVQTLSVWARLSAAFLGLAGLVILVATGASGLLAQADDFARVSPAAGVWCLLLVFMMIMADALLELRPGPWLGLFLLIGAGGALWLLLASGALSDLSVMQEYHARMADFRTATLRHVALALGSLVVSAVIGFPLGIWCHRNPRMRSAAIPVLSFLQTIPSLAMFGIMIPMLAWVATTLPGAAAMGIAGIGLAPAFLALLLYSLLPVVANTVAGLDATPATALETARGIGMTNRQRLWQVELPLALPVVLAGLRIVLVQNIGLAVIAGLIGGGGYGAFVFQGLNQGATDLILLGALPTVVFALGSAIFMDILVALTHLIPKQHRR